MDRVTAREVKVFRLGQLVQQHPTYSYTRLNRELIKEFGTGLRKQYTLELIRGIRPIRITEVKPAEDTYNGRYKILKNNGFYSAEAKKLAMMKDIKPENRAATFNTATWQAAIKAHKSYVQNLVNDRMKVNIEMAKKAGASYSPEQLLRVSKRDVEELLKRAMRSKEYDPYDWLKIEYRPKKTPTGYQREARARAVDKLNEIIDKVKSKKRVQFWD